MHVHERARVLGMLLAWGASAGLLGCAGEVGGGAVGDGNRDGDGDIGDSIRLLDGGSPGGGEAGDGLSGDGGSSDASAADGGLDGVPPEPGDTPSDAGASYTCEELGYTGICDGDIARWCDGGEIKMRDCAASGQTCYWIDDTTGNYCGDTPPDGDPGVDAGTGGGGGTAPTTCASAVEARQLELTNQARADAGLAPLVCDEALARAARLHSQDMCDQGYFSHASLDGRSFTDRLDEQGATYGAAGENIAHGQRTAEDVHNAWMGSPGHRANILTSGFRRIGIGHVDCGGSPYWTQDFTD